MTLDKTNFERLASFRYQLRLFLRFSENACRGHGLTQLQYQLLLQIRGFPGRDWATIGELAERLQAQHHGIVALVSRCVSLGLVERRPSERDRRQIEVHLTPHGKHQVEELAKEHQQELRQLQELLAITDYHDNLP